MPKQNFPEATLLGVRVHGPTVDEALGCIEQWLAERSDGCRFVVATGFHGLWEAQNDAEFHAALNAADLFCPDGIAAVLLARLKGEKFPGRVTGNELLAGMLARSRAGGYRNFFYGDTDETLCKLVERFPAAAIAGTFSPPFRPLEPDEEKAHVEAINASGADIVWVGLGCPRQEAWIARNRHRLTASVAIGVGAAFRFQAGMVRQAPRWIGEAGFEWAWRLAAEPRKMWRRDLKDGPRFFAAALRDLWATRGRTAP